MKNILVTNGSLYVLAGLSILIAGLGLAGCGSGDAAGNLLAQTNGSNIERVRKLYGVFQGQHRLTGPKDQTELETFIKEQDVKRLTQMGVDLQQLDQLFISERDNQPFKIRWRLVLKPRQAPIPIVFEEQGVDGKFQVAFSGQEVREVDQVEYDQLWKGKVDKKMEPRREQ